MSDSESAPSETPSENAASTSTPLRRFLDELPTISSRTVETRCAGVLDKAIAFPETSSEALDECQKIFTKALEELDWWDMKGWIDSWIRPYQRRMEALSRVSRDVLEFAKSHFVIMNRWNRRLRSLLDLKAEKGYVRLCENRNILCGFSSAVDATYAIDDEDSDGKTGLDRLLEHAATTISMDPQELLAAAFRLYQDDPTTDRMKVESVAEAIAALMFGFENHDKNLKPTLEAGSPAEAWMRQFYIDNRDSELMGHLGGGASVNIGDALAGLGFTCHFFWPYHSQRLANTLLSCSGGSGAYRCWFDDHWNWGKSDFDEEGGKTDQTGCPHPVRMSLILPFTAETTPIKGGFRDIVPTQPGRVIFQFHGYRPPVFFAQVNSGVVEGVDLNEVEWKPSLIFCRWRGADENTPVEAVAAESEAVQNIPVNYHRLILSGFQHVKEKTAIEELGNQCDDMNVHHEISSGFETRNEVENYCSALRSVYEKAAEKTAGMNHEELTAFTSWDHTTVYAVTPPAERDSFLQSYFRAEMVRSTLKLDWLYVHGNDIDIAVVRKDPNVSRKQMKEFMGGLRDAMLLAKAAVFAALHVRSGITNVNTDDTDLAICCSPKGFLALYQFSLAFARQYGASEAHENRLLEQLLFEGYVLDDDKHVPLVITVPVYWPPTKKGCSLTGAGDITSGITASFAPSWPTRTESPEAP